MDKKSKLKDRILSLKNDDLIRRKAYFIHLETGSHDHLRNWYLAEKELVIDLIKKYYVPLISR